MKPLAQKLGIDPALITFQVLRRTFGTTMQKHGSMKDVQAHLRHASILAVPQLGQLLRYWRQERGKSQLDLSMDTGISQRHLSFVESGRSVPSRDFLSIVSDALNIPPRERNVLLLASGYAPQYSEQSMDVEQMAIVT